MFGYNFIRYEIKPSAFGLPVDAQAIMEKHLKEMTIDLEMIGCTEIICLGEID